MGAISPVGNTLKESWNNIMSYNKSRTNNDQKVHSSSSSSSSSSFELKVTNGVGITTLEQALVEQHRQGYLTNDQLERELQLASTLPCQVAAPVKYMDEHYEQLIERLQHQQQQTGTESSLLLSSLSYDPRRTARSVQFALLAGCEAMEQSGLLLEDWLQNKEEQQNDDHHDQSRRHRMGVCIGSGMSSVREVTQSWDIFNTMGYRKLSPQFIPKVLTNSPAGRLSLAFGFQGPNTAPSTACAASAHAIGEAMKYIEYGTADVMLAGGTEASIEPLGIAGFCRLRALSTNYNTTPHKSSRPFDTDRDGFVMGEGAAILVLEELEHAQKRGATILAELSGYGLSSDAFHITAPDEFGRGAARAMKMALQDAASKQQLQQQEEEVSEECHYQRMKYPSVDYVNAHATSTPKGDEIEAQVIHRVVNDVAAAVDQAAYDCDVIEQTTPREVFVSSTKGATGHLLGAAGALEAAFTVMSLVQQELPPTANLECPDSTTLFDDEGQKERKVKVSHVMEQSSSSSSSPLPHPIESAMSNSFGFGGTNASLLFYKDI